MHVPEHPVRPAAATDAVVVGPLLHAFNLEYGLVVLQRDGCFRTRGPARAAGRGQTGPIGPKAHIGFGGQPPRTGWLGAGRRLVVHARRGLEPEDATVMGTVAIDCSGAATRIILGGEWDIANVGILWQALAEAAERELDRVVVDLGAVTFIDLRVVACLLAVRADLKARNTTLEVTNATGAALRTLELSGAEDLVREADPRVLLRLVPRAEP